MQYFKGSPQEDYLAGPAASILTPIPAGRIPLDLRTSAIQA